MHQAKEVSFKALLISQMQSNFLTTHIKEKGAINIK